MAEVNPNPCTPTMLMFIQIQLKLRVVSKSHRAGIEIDPNLFGFTFQVGFDSLPGFHHLERGIEEEEQEIRTKQEGLGKNE
jgi:hypothetical protein